MLRSPIFWLIVWGIIFGVRVRSLTHACYFHVEELIRANAHAGQRTIHAKERAEVRPWRRSEAARGLYQPTAVTPVHPFRHVWLLPGPLFILLPIRPFLRGVVIHWSPLVRYPHGGVAGRAERRGGAFLARVRLSDSNARAPVPPWPGDGCSGHFRRATYRRASHPRSCYSRSLDDEPRAFRRGPPSRYPP